jgi:hypothetical protein
MSDFYATLVTVIRRTNGVADGRYRQMIAVCDEPVGKTCCRDEG